ncbi:MAG: EamA family transporter [bacterium]
MKYLFFSIFCSVAVANLLKLFSRDNKSSSLFIFLGNYLIASVIGFLFISKSSCHIHPSDILISGMSGLFFLSGFIYYMKNITVNGLSVSVSTFRMSLVLPIAGSMILFGEYLSLINYVGILLIFVAFLLLGSERRKYNLLLLAILFLIAGCTDFFPKLYTKFNNHNPNSFYLALNFSFAFAFNLILILFRRMKFSFDSFIRGMVLGIPNFFAAFFLMKSFDTISGTLAYPILSASTVILTMTTDYVFWKKRFSKKEYIIFSIIITGVVLTVASI